MKSLNKFTGKPIDDIYSLLSMNILIVGDYSHRDILESNYIARDNQDTSNMITSPMIAHNTIHAIDPVIIPIWQQKSTPIRLHLSNIIPVKIVRLE